MFMILIYVLFIQNLCNYAWNFCCAGLAFLGFTIFYTPPYVKGFILDHHVFLPVRLWHPLTPKLWGFLEHSLQSQILNLSICSGLSYSLLQQNAGNLRRIPNLDFKDHSNCKFIWLYKYFDDQISWLQLRSWELYFFLKEPSWAQVHHQCLKMSTFHTGMIIRIYTFQFSNGIHLIRPLSIQDFYIRMCLNICYKAHWNVTPCKVWSSNKSEIRYDR